MKARLLIAASLVTALTTLSLLTGCTQQSASRPNAYVVTSNSAPPPVLPPVGFTPPPQALTPTPETPAPAPATEPPVAVAPLIISNAAPAAPEPLPASDLATPANVRISQAMREMIRLSQAGLDETVMLTYATNSPAMFLLGAEEIVYLNDLGVPSPVITAMMQRDQALKVAWHLPAPAATPDTNPAVAVAPSYVTPPAQTETPPAAAPAYVSDHYFYDNLSPYGSWIEVDGYGRVWRPTVVVTSPGWQPYRDRGRWVYTDAGWYWWSDYSWGSIAFHYGRWFSHPRWGWCWWPDNVWAPSWVTWRYDNSYCGWAPLPPRSYYRPGAGFYYQDRHVSIGFDFGFGAHYYSYVPWSRFHDPRPYNHCLPRDRSVVIHKQTTVINDFSSGRNHTVVNRGIPSDRVREHSRVEVRPVNLREERTTAAGPRPARLERDGRTLVVNRPALTTTASTPSVRAGDRGDARFNGISSGANPANRSSDRPNREATPARENRPITTRPTPGQNNLLAPARREDRPPNSERTTVITTPAPAATPSGPTPARSATPIFSKPVVVQTTPQLPSRPVVTQPAVAPRTQPVAPISGGSENSTRRPGAAAERISNRPESAAPTRNFTPPSTRPETSSSREERSPAPPPRNARAALPALSVVNPSTPRPSPARPRPRSTPVRALRPDPATRPPVLPPRPGRSPAPIHRVRNRPAPATATARNPAATAAAAHATVEKHHGVKPI